MAEVNDNNSIVQNVSAPENIGASVVANPASPTEVAVPQASTPQPVQAPAEAPLDEALKNDIKQKLAETVAAQPAQTTSPLNSAAPQQKVSKDVVSKKVNFGTGINLVPPVSEEKIIVEEKKTRFNLGGILAIFLFVLFSLAIVGYNVITKQNLNNEKNKIFNTTDGLEKQVGRYTDTITRNNKLNRRIQLFDSIQQGAVSYKQILDYWDTVSKNIATINSVRMTSTMVFKVNGNAQSYTDVAKLWHFLSIDDKVENVNLKSVGSTVGKGVDFEFEGKLKFESFK